MITSDFTSSGSVATRQVSDVVVAICTMAENELEKFFAARQSLEERYFITKLRDYVLNNLVITGTTLSDVFIYSVLQCYVQQRKDLKQYRGKKGGIGLASDEVPPKEKDNIEEATRQ
ncbi:MAG: hypothetical protein KGH64_06155 [Candidatus Micrarchaeota archaeon]|nr:hypothetical protein [Candidatus Micrarchaeota archaeon]